MATVANWKVLQICINAGQFDRAVDTARQILESDAGNPDAEQALVVALLNSGQFDEALAASASKPLLLFEHAYALYRLNKLDDLKTFLDSGPAKGSSDLRLTQLRAQVLYKLSDYSKAADLYASLQRSDPTSADIATNLTAALVAGARAEELLGRADLRVKNYPGSYEMMFNAACAQISAGQFVEALASLEEAQTACRATLAEEGLTPEEIVSESAVIGMQTAFVLQKLGYPDAARAAYESVLKSRPSDPKVAALAETNRDIIVAMAARSSDAATSGEAASSSAEGTSVALADDDWGIRRHKKRSRRSKASEKKRRLRKRAEYVAKLAAESPTGYVPVPNPDRWKPKYQRGGRRRHRRGKVDTVGAQGSNVAKADLDKLDALKIATDKAAAETKAQADAKAAKAAKKAGVGAGAGAAAPAPAPAAASGGKKKGKKGKKGKR